MAGDLHQDSRGQSKAHLGRQSRGHHSSRIPDRRQFILGNAATETT